jgi:predicted metal-dependent peptidase
MSTPTIDVQKITDNIITARVGLLLQHPFFGTLATRLIIKEGGPWCKTASTEGRHIFYNKEFFAPLSVAHIQFVLAHEILHNAFDHMGRREGRHPKIHNWAADYCVNGQIVRDKIGDWKIPGINILHDTQYYGMGSEEIYDILKDQNDEQLDKLGELLDQHIDWTEPDENDDGSGNGRPVYTKDEWSSIRDEMREAIMTAAQAAGAGNTPGLIQRMITDLVEPKMNWREILRQQIQSVIKSDYTWMKPSRKGWHLSAVLPGSNVQDTIDICVCIDMSGSISDEQARDFLSEIKGIMEVYQDFKIKLWCFDTQVYNEQDFDGYTIDEFDSYQPMGGGGTDFDVNWEYMKDHDIQPKKFIMFTDGYPCGSWGDELYCDTIFIIHGNNTIVPPFGEYAYYEEVKANS